MLPLQRQPIAAFLGDDQSKSSLVLSDLYSSGGSENLYIDKTGRIRTISGYSKQTADPLTTDTGGTAAKIIALFPYRKTAAGTFTRHIMAVIDDGVNEWELWYSTDEGATFTFIADLGSSSVGAIPSFVQFGDELWIVNGVITARMWNGTSLTTGGATQLGAPTLNVATAGLLSGKFKWRLVPILTGNTRKPGSVASALTQITAKQAVLSWTADADTDVIGYEVYRTSGTGNVFLFINYVAGRTTATYTDNLPDTDLIGRRVLAEHGDAPPTGCHDLCQHKGRVWYFRTDTYPRRGWHADPGDADSVYGDENYIDFTEADTMGDVHIGAVGDHDGMLYEFQERSVFTVSGTGTLIDDRLDWRRRRTNARVGAASKRGIVKVPKGARYFDEKGEEHTTVKATLAYFTPLGDVRLIDTDSDTIISAGVEDRIADFAYAQRSKVWALIDTLRRHIIWFYPEAGETRCTAAVAWNYNLGTWHHWSGLPFGHGIVAETSTASQLILVGDNRTATGAYVYEFWNGTTFDGAAFTSTLMTKPIWPRDRQGNAMLSQLIRHRHLTLLFEKDASPDNVVVSWLPYDAADADDPVDSRPVTGSSRVQIQLADQTGRHYTNYAARYRISAVGGRGWICNGGELAYQALEGQKHG